MAFGISRKEIFPFLFVLITLITSGFVPFMSMRDLVILFLPAAIFLVQQRRIRLSRLGFIAILVISFLHFLNYIAGHLTLIGFFESSLFYTSVIFAVHLLNCRFVRYYTRMMYFFSIISIVFWVLISCFPSLHSALLSLDSIVPQNVNDDWLENTTNSGTHLYIVYVAAELVSGIYRNPGPFYEPGLFASFLSIALIFNIARMQNKLFTRQNIVMLCALITTFSSAGYIQLILILLYYVLSQESRLWKILLIMSLPFLIISIYNLDFMGEKIASNYEDAAMNSYSRFGAIIYHLEKIQESPIIGYGGGLIPKTRLDAIMQGYNGHMISPNGISWVFVYWGIPLGILFYFLLYKSIKVVIPNVNRRWKYNLIFLIILSAAFSQTITTLPIFFCLLFMALPQLKYNEDSSC